MAVTWETASSVSGSRASGGPYAALCPSSGCAVLSDVSGVQARSWSLSETAVVAREALKTVSFRIMSPAYQVCIFRLVEALVAVRMDRAYPHAILQRTTPCIPTMVRVADDNVGMKHEKRTELARSSLSHKQC